MRRRAPPRGTGADGCEGATGCRWIIARGPWEGKGEVAPAARAHIKEHALYPITKRRGSLVAIVHAVVDEKEPPLRPADDFLAATARGGHDYLRRSIEADDADAGRVVDEQG